MVFQWKYFNLAPYRRPVPNVLNIGCSDDPMGFGSYAVHFDLDFWPRFDYFAQGDAHRLPFATGSFDTVIMGDILEHVLEPVQVVQEACRVAARRMVMTVFEEWKLPGPGRHIEEGQANADEQSRGLGYLDREDYQIRNFPDRKGYSDTEQPHLIHIWQFTDDMITEFCKVEGFRVREFTKAYEASQNGHDWSNWLACLERETAEVPL